MLFCLDINLSVRVDHSMPGRCRGKTLPSLSMDKVYAALRVMQTEGGHLCTQARRAGGVK